MARTTTTGLSGRDAMRALSAETGARSGAARTATQGRTPCRTIMQRRQTSLFTSRCGWMGGPTPTCEEVVALARESHRCWLQEMDPRSHSS